ncbi:MAG: hypothetical protein HQK96_15450 [Nitrospirae bacterium]|nr:hypothetical protein [Nitrospirota bacterium]
MTVLAGIACYLLIIFYDWSKKDWLGIETVKGLQKYEGNSKIRRFASYVLKRSDAVVMLFLSVKYDAFITTAYMRHGSYQFNGMSKRDWKIFFLSLLLSNIYWTLAAFTGVTVIEYAWKHLFR